MSSDSLQCSGIAQSRYLGYNRSCRVYDWFPNPLKASGAGEGITDSGPCAEVAQLVEHVTENHGVRSSILRLGTFVRKTHLKVPLNSRQRLIVAYLVAYRRYGTEKVISGLSATSRCSIGMA